MKDQKEYIERGALIAEYDRVHVGPAGGARKLMVDALAADVVSKGVYEQVQWERDMAMQQLEEHGIPFGGTADNVVEVVRCKDCEHYKGEQNNCWLMRAKMKPNDFCSYGERKEQT